MRSFSDGNRSSSFKVVGPRPYPTDGPLTVLKRRTVSEGRNRLSSFKGIFRRSIHEDDIPETPQRHSVCSETSPDTPEAIARARDHQEQSPTKRKSLSIKTSFFSNLFPRQSRQFSGQSIASTSSTVDGESPITPTQGPGLLRCNSGGKPFVPQTGGAAETENDVALVRTSSGTYERDDSGYSPLSSKEASPQSLTKIRRISPLPSNAPISLAFPLGDMLRHDMTSPENSKEYQVGLSVDPFWNSMATDSLTTFTSELEEPTIRFVGDLHTPRFAPNPFNIPEIVSLVVHHLNAMNPVPHEVAPKRRKPMSWRHAMLLYGNKSTAWQALSEESPNTNSLGAPFQKKSSMLACMLVNKLWYEETARVMYKELHFQNSGLFAKFAECNGLKSTKMPWGAPTLPGPKLLVLHKLATASQSDIDKVAQQIGGSLEWLEFYTCPKLFPSRELIRGGTLKKVIVPGCTTVNDSIVSAIARDCPLLEHLDLRACEEVSDKSIRVVAHYCRNLTMLNVGRTHGGQRITNRGIRSIARHTKITTLGVAGCHINDTTIWELAIHRGPYLERLSLNNCFFLTNNSIPRVLGYTTQNLSVLELRGCPLISNMMPFVMFKRYRQAKQGFAPLIEGCELFETRMREAEYSLEMEISKQIFMDTLEWIYAPDSDVEYVPPKSCTLEALDYTAICPTTMPTC